MSVIEKLTLVLFPAVLLLGKISFTL